MASSSTPDLHELAPRRSSATGNPGVRREANASQTLREAQRQLGDHVQTLRIVEQLDMVEHQGNRIGHGRDGGHEPRHRGARQRDAGGGEGLEHPGSIGSTRSRAATM